MTSLDGASRGHETPCPRRGFRRALPVHAVDHVRSDLPSSPSGILYVWSTVPTYQVPHLCSESVTAGGRCHTTKVASRSVAPFSRTIPHQSCVGALWPCPSLASRLALRSASAASGGGRRGLPHENAASGAACCETHEKARSFVSSAIRIYRLQQKLCTRRFELRQLRSDCLGPRLPATRAAIREFALARLPPPHARARTLMMPPLARSHHRPPT